MSARLAAPRLTLAFALALVLALAGGCATAPDEPAAGPAVSPDPVTASDETELQRRARLRLELASAYFAEGQYATALDEVKQALVSQPDSVPAFNLRGLIHAALGDAHRATESFERALALDPRDADSLHNYGYFRCQRGQWAEADALFDRALALPAYRQPARTLMVQGICARQAGDLPRAQALLQRAFDLDAGQPIAAMNLAEVLLRLGQAERARFYVKRVNDRAELRNAESLWLQARIEHRLGHTAEVAALGQQLRSRHPEARETAAFERGAFDE